ncbi:MAG: CinA family protein [Elusimicrobia bacterium]|nr:CinA family protein [Elusimicrobiota bacterium]
MNKIETIIPLKKSPVQCNKKIPLKSKTLQYKLGEIFRQKNLSLSVAESCTGGLISKMITEVAGSSFYFKGGLTAYSNETKLNVLGVRKKTLSSFGAVSPQCAFEMALRARKIFKTDFAISTTGIAGPNGATDKKPLGLVYFGIAAPKGTEIYKRIFKGNRKYIQEKAANFALNLLLKNIK